jgi:hypothetical protein
MTVTELYSINQVLAEVTSYVDDTGMKRGFSRGWYLNRMKDALVELAVLSPSSEKKKSIYDIQDCDAVKLRSGVIGIESIRVFRGESCDDDNSVNLDIKFNAMNHGRGYTADIQENGNSDHTSTRSSKTSDGLMWVSIVNDELHFSPQARKWPKAMVIHRGVGIDIEGYPIIPAHLKPAVVSYVELQYLRVMKNRNPREYRGVYADQIVIHDNAKKDAIIAAGRMDAMERRRLNDYRTHFMTK